MTQATLPDFYKAQTQLFIHRVMKAVALGKEFAVLPPNMIPELLFAVKDNGSSCSVQKIDRARKITLLEMAGSLELLPKYTGGTITTRPLLSPPNYWTSMAMLMTTIVVYEVRAAQDQGKAFAAIAEGKGWLVSCTGCCTHVAIRSKPLRLFAGTVQESRVCKFLQNHQGASTAAELGDV